ncbi:MAG TPA: 30S ribosomal protein S3 [Actinomycetota bacterium]|jgi:small subunit ribosomal protein S3|nr:30S ribosomal protein S3 [Actinomycetota bacterium]
MGQKINPYGFRLGVTTDWKAKWFAEGEQYRKYIHEDIGIRDYIRKELPHGMISRVDIERTRDRVRVDIHTARPGIVIGRRGAEVEHLKQQIQKMTGTSEVRVDALEVQQPQLEAPLLAQAIAEQIAGRISFRRAMRRSVQEAMRAGAKGIKVQCSGRLAGAEMARTESYREGRVPLTTLRADIDYGFYESKTKYGRIGCKVWIYKGEILPTREEERIRKAAQERVRRRARRRAGPAEEGAAPEAASAEAAPAEQPAADSGSAGE